MTVFITPIENLSKKGKIIADKEIFKVRLNLLDNINVAEIRPRQESHYRIMAMAIKPKVHCLCVNVLDVYSILGVTIDPKIDNFNGKNYS
jgi:hypothetical protein